MSIKNRIFLYFLLFTAMLLVLLWLFQIVFLDDFYRLQMTDMLKTSSDSILRNIDHEEIATLINRVSEENNLCALVTDADMNTLYSADTAFGCIIHHINKRDLRRMTDKLKGDTAMIQMPLRGFRTMEYDEKKFDGRVPPKDDGNAESIVLVRSVALKDGRIAFVFLNTLVTPVTSTVQTIRNELLFITAILVLLSFVLSSVLSRRISKPIMDTTAAARALSRSEYTPVTGDAQYREIVELNDQLVRTAKDLKRVEEMQRELIANISHDLRTPLTLIEGYAEVMRDLPGENTPENMQVIIGETKRLSTLVNAVLDYSKQKNGAGALKPERFNLTQSIREIIARYGKLTEQDGYRILFEPEGDVYVKADAMQLSQVVYNLVNNALTYTGADKTVRISQTLVGHQARVEIRDSGDGISKDELPFIWSRYYRSQKPHKRPAVGTGLGLSIVQSILERHGMRYGVTSEEGKGSCFWFEAEQDEEGERSI